MSDINARHLRATDALVHPQQVLLQVIVCCPE